MTEQPAAHAARVVLLDIEGTIAPIDFVYEVMFPYARRHLRPYLTAKLDAPAVRATIDALRAQSEADREAGLHDAPTVAPPTASADDLIDSSVAFVQWQMDSDRKTTALKALQGMIWRGGFESGELQSVVFGDVPDALRRFKEQGRAVAIYSSGSVAAQRLFMRYNRAGDLSRWVDAWFDTTTGPKREASSYAAIARQLQAEPGEVVFATDVAEEAVAARQAGVRAVVFDRPGNRPQPAHDFPVAQTLDAL